MKNTKQSLKSNSTRKISSFRLLLKNRSNPKQIIQFKKSLSQSIEVSISANQTTKNYSTISNQQMLQLKNYVKKRMKTDYDTKSKNESIKSHHDSFRQSKNKLNSKENETLSQKKSLKNTLPELQPMTIETLQMKIDFLLEAKLNILNQSHKKTNLSMNFDKQLDSIILQLKEIKQQENPQSIDSDIDLLAKKIYVLQKIIAENMTESDIMKKFFLSQISNKPSQNIYSQSAKKFYREASNYKVKYSEDRRVGTIDYTTINKQQYKKPKRADYLLDRHLYTQYDSEKHRQPLPRSMYRRQYLNFGACPGAPCIPKDQGLFNMPPSKKKITSLYQDSFQNKTADNINYKELDAYRNKIKDLAVLFGRKQKQQLKYRYANYLAKIGIGKKKQLNINVDQSNRYLKNHLLTESRRSYHPQKNSPIQSSIKHENLTKMKYILKKKMHT